MVSFRLLKPSITTTFIVLLMALQISACSTEEQVKKVSDITTSDTTNTSADTGGTGGTGDTGGTGGTGANQAALITGTDNGSITEDNDPDRDNLLEVIGKLNVTDADAGEETFIASTQLGIYGNLTINTAGNWSYAASNNQAAVQNLTNNDSLQDNLTVSSIDGTTHTVVITIIGADDPVADVSLSWVAPSEREDNTGLDLSEIAGYKIYYGPAQGNYSSSVDINDSSAEGYTFRNFSAGRYYFVVTTFDTEGRESQYSSEVTIVI